MRIVQPQPGTKFSTTRRKLKPGTILLIALLHVLAIYGLAKAFAPSFTASVEDEVLSTFTVTVTTPEPPAAIPEPLPDEGAAGDPGKEAVPAPTSAPVPQVRVRREVPAPRAASTGSADSSGARDTGTGTGASGSGEGRGSGQGGSGQGGIAVTKPVKIAGDINAARDFPTPPGGRQIRWGQEVIVSMTVGTDGRATACRVVKPSPDPEADRIVCELAQERFRFRPALDGNGEPVPSTYGWRQWWSPSG